MRRHALDALNFQIPVSVVGSGPATSSAVRRVLLFTGGDGRSRGCSASSWAVAIFGIVFGVIAGIRANEGQPFKYPLNIDIIK